MKAIRLCVYLYVFRSGLEETFRGISVIYELKIDWTNIGNRGGYDSRKE